MKQKNTFNTFYSRIVLFSGIALLFSVTTIHAQTWTFAGAGGSANAENGKAILTSIPAPHHPMVMVTLSNKDVLLGQLLFL